MTPFEQILETDNFIFNRIKNLAEETEEKEEPKDEIMATEEYPYGDMVEPYDIEMEKHYEE